MAKNKGIKKIEEYEKEGYKYEVMDVEAVYTEDGGERVIIQVVLKRLSGNSRAISEG